MDLYSNKLKIVDQVVKTKNKSKAIFVAGLSVGLFGSWDDNMANDLKTPGPSSDTYNCSDSPAKLFEFGNKCKYPTSNYLPAKYECSNSLVGIRIEIR